VEGFCEHGNELSSSINMLEISSVAKRILFLRMDTAPLS
jgi:hypothetical protein